MPPELRAPPVTSEPVDAAAVRVEDSGSEAEGWDQSKAGKKKAKKRRWEGDREKEKTPEEAASSSGTAPPGQPEEKAAAEKAEAKTALGNALFFSQPVAPATAQVLSGQFQVLAGSNTESDAKMD